jgi:Putative peptidoglycan binding domain
MSVFRKQILCTLLATLGTFGSCNAFILDEEVFSVPSTDSLAQRDSHGLLHQSKELNSTDFERRHHWRWVYYFQAPEQVSVDPAYVGALQRDLLRLGYYCGPIDGVFTGEVSEAIARLQKNNSMRVTGTLTNPVRRALHLP